MKNDEKILDKFFALRQDDLMNEMPEDRAYLKRVLKQTKDMGITDMICQLPEEYNSIKQEIEQKFEDVIGDYEVKLAYYNKKYYKQGFYDALVMKLPK
ncbi:MAG: hypothetical protein HFJ27_01070 [Clostridia bacterium]|nr:hypothetical protein [Clostridia bacterium]